jgi:hypothetical protein
VVVGMKWGLPGGMALGLFSTRGGSRIPLWKLGLILRSLKSLISLIDSICSDVVFKGRPSLTVPNAGAVQHQELCSMARH